MKEKIFSAIAISIGITLLTGIGTYLLMEEKAIHQQPQPSPSGVYAEIENEQTDTDKKESSTDAAHTENPAPEYKIDINSATEDELDALPGIGKTLAGRIIEYRKEKPFKRIYDLKKVSGIGDKTFRKLEKFIQVGP